MGGIEKHARDLFNEQNKAPGSTSYVIAHPRYKEMFKNHKNFHSLDTDKSRKNPFFLLKTLRLLNKINAEIVHGHGEKPAAILKSIRYFRHFKAVVTSHNLNKPKDKIAKFFDGRVSVSKKNIEKSQLNWEVIANGIDTTHQTETSNNLKLPNETINIAVIGRMVPAKGFDFFIESIPHLKQNIYCYVIGDGREKSKLEKRCKELNIGNRVHFAGYQNNINEWLQNLDLFVMPSRNEGAPYILVESLHAYCPSIATDVGNATEILPPEAIIKQTNPEELAQIINRFSKKRKLNQDLFSDYFSFAKETLTTEKMNEHLMSYYKSMNSL